MATTAAMPSHDIHARHATDEDMSDTSSIGSGDWTDLSSAAPDDVSDAASLDGDDRPRPVSELGTLDDGSEEAWTTAEASTSPAASLYASAHSPLNPFAIHSPVQRPVHSPELGYGTFSPLDPFRAPSDADSGPSRESGSAHELQLILPDPLERSDSTVAADLSFSDDAVLATQPVFALSLAGVSPSVAQRATVVADVLRAVAKATQASCVRPDYHNFTTLSDLPKRVKLEQEYIKEISVLVCDHTHDAQNHSHDDAPSILVAFTSDLHHSTFPHIPIHSILIPVVVNDAAGPVVLFDEDREDRADETAVDVEDLVRRISNSLAADHHSETATQTAVDTFDGRSFASDDVDDALLNTDYDTPDEKSDRKFEARVAPKHEFAPRVVQELGGSELADALKHAAKSVSPRWATACAFAVMLSLLLGTGHHLIQTARQDPVPTGVTILPVSTARTSLALRSPHTSLAPKSPHTSLALKSPHTSLAVKSTQTGLSVKSAQTALSVKSTQTALAEVSHVPINESCSTAVSISVSSAVASPSTSTSLSTTTAQSSMAMTTTTSTASPASTSMCTETERARTLANVAEDLSGALERVERLLGWNIRESLAASGAKEAAEVRHQNAKQNAQRKLANLKRGVGTFSEKVGLGNTDGDKGKGKESAKGKERTVKGQKKSKPRPGREKWQTAKDRATEQGKTKSCKGKAPFPSREEQERAHASNRRNKRPTTQEPTWTWTVEEEWVEYERPRTVMEEVREYIQHGFVF